MSDRTSNVFSFCLGGLALISAITSTILYYRAFLPNAQMKILDDLLRETKEIYVKAEAEGLLPGALFRSEIRKQLSHFERSSEILRGHAYQATTPVDEYIGLMKGLSTKIIRIGHDVKKLRSLLITTSQRESLRREQELSLSQENADWSPYITQSETDVINASDTGVRGCLPEMAGIDDNSLSLPPPPSLVSAHPIDFRVDVHGVVERLNDPDNQRLLTHAHTLGENGATLSAEQLAALSALLDRRASPCCVCSLLDWWKGRADSSSDDVLRNLEDQRPAHPDALSRSSTFIDEPPLRKPWSILAGWRLGPGQGKMLAKTIPHRPWYFLGFRSQEVGDEAISVGSLPP